jgi:heptose-I-phosphate ethanolaminephosphotransferase
MQKTVSFFTKFIVSPILEQFPFFFSFLLLFGGSLIGVPISLLLNYDPTWALGFAKLVGSLFIYDYILTCIIYYTKSKTVKICLYILIIFIYGLNSFLEQNFNYSITPNVLLLVLETNGREASEFIDLFAFSKASLTTYGKVIIRIIIIVTLELTYFRYIYHRDSCRKLKSILILPVILLLIWGFSTFGPLIRICRHNTLDNLFQQQTMELFLPSDPISSTIMSLRSIYLIGNEMKNAVEITKNIKDIAPISDKTDSLNIILVIGESFNKWHSEIYGYHHSTTPYLNQEAQKGNLFAFNNAVCPFCLTSHSVKNILSCNSISDGEAWSQAPFFPAIFKAAQYNVYFWSNQKTYQSDAFPTTISLNSYLFDKDISHSSYTAINDSTFRYDDELVSSLLNSSQQFSDHNLIIFHLMGQHFDAKERFPHNKEFLRYTADSIQRNEDYLQDIEKKQCIADYDNAIIYNDYVIKHIIDFFQHKNTVIVFLTDHGEEVYDYKDGIHRHYEGHMTKGWIKHVHNIPFFIWCSDKYINNHQTTVNSIRNAIDRPFMTDNLCQLMFHLGEIKSDYYITERDPISDQFKPRKRLIEDLHNNKKYDYDEIWLK